MMIYMARKMLEKIEVKKSLKTTVSFIEEELSTYFKFMFSGRGWRAASS